MQNQGSRECKIYDKSTKTLKTIEFNTLKNGDLFTLTDHCEEPFCNGDVIYKALTDLYSTNGVLGISCDIFKEEVKLRDSKRKPIK